MIAELNPETTEILESKEGEEYIYKKVLFKQNDMILGTRKLKTDNSVQVCLDDYVKEHLSLKEGHTGDLMKEFLKNAVVCLYLNKGLIEKDSETGLYYMEPLTIVQMIELAEKHPYGSSLDWNVTAPNTLTVYGLLNVSLGAILGGFSIDNDKFESLAKTNGIANILLNGFDGSGHLAGGNIVWDAIGNLLIRGIFESNNNGNRIIIDPTTRSFNLLNKAGVIVGYWSFSDDYCKINMKGNGSNLDITPAYIGMRDNTGKIDISNGFIELSTFESDGQTEKTNFSINYMNDSNTLKIIAKWLPTSEANIETGQIWNDNGTLKIKI